MYQLSNLILSVLFIAVITTLFVYLSGLTDHINKKYKIVELADGSMTFYHTGFFGLDWLASGDKFSDFETAEKAVQNAIQTFHSNNIKQPSLFRPNPKTLKIFKA